MASPESALQDLLLQKTRTRFPAVSLAIGKGSQIIWHEAAGYADVENGTRNTPETLFGIGSITKVFIAVLALQLNEEGLLPLDAPVSRWLDEKLLSRIAHADTATPRQLLSHYAAVPSWEDDPGWISDARGKHLNPERRWMPHETLDYIRGKKALSLPAEKFHYSNTHFTLLGLLIEKITQNSLEAELSKRILAPLSLKNTCMAGAALAKSGNLAGKYHRLDAAFIQNAGFSPHFHPAPYGLINVSASSLAVEWAAGGIVSTAQDIMTFILALKNAQLLNPQSMKAMQRWLPAESGEMGLSLFRIETDYGPALGHGGNVLGFSACVWWYQHSDCAVAILTNAGSMHADPQADCASRFFRESEAGKLAQEIASRYAGDSDPVSIHRGENHEPYS